MYKQSLICKILISEPLTHYRIDILHKNWDDTEHEIIDSLFWTDY